MRVGVLWDRVTNGKFYRSIYPMQALGSAGHEIVWPDLDSGVSAYARLRACDVLHVYRRADKDTLALVRRLCGDGVPLVYDNDDNLAVVPRGAENYAGFGGLRGQRAFAASCAMARLAAVVTVTGPVLADVYRAAGAQDVRVLENRLGAGVLRPTRRIRAGAVVVGWIAGAEHRVDADRIGLREALEQVLERHPDVAVECIGLDLKLRSSAYRHTASEPFERLPQRIGGFDIGIAPLCDVPFNRARSDIKLKEYAASGVAWLASPVGPYAGLGEREGGRLVDDGAWARELDRLIVRARDRRRLGRRGRRWARRQTVRSAIDRWEAVLADAAATRVAASAG